MKIYLAGTSVSNPKFEKTLQDLFKTGSKLHSYYHCQEGFEKDWFIMNIKNKVELFLDSGAFSAWSQGKKINIKDYISFIKEHENVIDVYANLDVIGDPKATWDNQRIMEKAELKPLPVYHHGDEKYDKWLKRYLDKGYDYISLGGMVPISTSDLKSWLDRIFKNYLTDASGTPLVKIHGFGLTSVYLMLRYPWYSVDSTSWVITGRMGSVFTPCLTGGQRKYDESSWKVTVSNRSPNKKDKGKHILTMEQIEKQVFLDYIHEKGYKLGSSIFKEMDQNHKPDKNERWFDKKPKDKSEKRLLEIIQEPGISNKYQLRDEMNIIYFLDLEKSMPEWPWAFKKEEVQNGFF